MENASKALIISGGVLVGLIILSLAVYLFNTMGGYAKKAQEDIYENAKTQFNEKFLRYEGRTDLTIQDVITAKNYALENNNQNGAYNWNITANRAANNNGYIDIYCSGNLAFSKSNEELLKNNIGKNFSCTIEFNNSTGRVNKVIFTEI